jgi:hypothetical protein
LASLVGVKEPAGKHTRREVRQRTTTDSPFDAQRRAILEQLHAEMVEAVAPAAEGPVVYPGRARSGRLVFGDATE